MEATAGDIVQGGEYMRRRARRERRDPPTAMAMATTTTTTTTVAAIDGTTAAESGAGAGGAGAGAGAGAGRSRGGGGGRGHGHGHGRGRGLLLGGLAVVAMVAVHMGGMPMRVGPPGASAFRLLNDEGVYEPFEPYEQGFTGYFNDPANYQRERVNEGSPNTPDYPRQFEDTHARQICPGMVGPLGDDKYYCLAKEYGYCDRRSGTCFCNMGYQGIDCGECTPSHYRMGSLCYPKKHCPNDCSGGGYCNYTTGDCHCDSQYWGDDCSKLNCQGHHTLCLECTNTTCVRCETGFSVSINGSDCLPCHRFDPRCSACNADDCLECSDPITQSSRRSGHRSTDPPLPTDEINRQLSMTMPFGTQDYEFFNDAEPFSLIAKTQGSGSVETLQDRSTACGQGYDDETSDGSVGAWSCQAHSITHKVCGHTGTLSWSSPTYQVQEDAGYLRVKLVRTGGGVGSFEVTYSLSHVSTNASDVTPTARYTTSQTVQFDEGVIELSWLITIHDDRDYEGDETFTLSLNEPTGSSSTVTLGPQRTTTVTIIDNDQPLTGWANSKFYGDYDCVAGEYCTYTIDAYSTTGVRQYTGGDRWMIEVTDKPNPPSSINNGGGVDGTVVYDDMGDGVFHASGTEMYEDTAEAGAWYTPVRPAREGQGMIIGQGIGQQQYGLGLGSQRRVSHTFGNISDVGNGSYTGGWTLDVQGSHELHAYLAVPGGLIGHYYDSPHFETSAYQMGRVDRVIDFQWGMGRITPYGADYVGVRWEGAIMPPHAFGSVEYTLAIIADDNVRLWLDNELVIDAWHVVPSVRVSGLSGREVSAIVTLTADELHKIALEYREIRRDAYITLSWSSTDTTYPLTSEVIPMTSLYHLHELDRSPKSLTVVSAATSARVSDAVGPGLYADVAGHPVSFTVRPRDQFGNLRSDQDSITLKRDAFAATAILIDNIGDGYGIHDVPVTFTYRHHTDDYATAQHSGVYEPHLTRSRHSGSTIDTMDGLGHALHEGVHPPPSRWSEFVGTYTPTISGVYQLHVWYDSELLFAQPYGTKANTYNVNDSPIDSEDRAWQTPNSSLYGSPFIVAVAPARTFAKRTRLWGDGVSVGAVGLIQTFYFESYDSMNNQRLTGGDNYQVTAHHADGMAEVVLGSITDYLNGTYSVRLRPIIKGPYIISVTLDGHHAASSPYDMFVHYGNATAPTSVVVGPGLSYAKVTVPTKFTFQARDPYHNDLEDGSWFERLTVSLVAPTTPYNVATNSAVDVLSNSGTVVSELVNYENGTAVCTYTALVAGNNLLHIMLDGNDIADSPYSVFVDEGPLKASTSSASGRGLRWAEAGKVASFSITARDHKGNVRTDDAGVDDSGRLDSFTVTLSHESQYSGNSALTTAGPGGPGYSADTYPIVFTTTSGPKVNNVTTIDGGGIAVEYLGDGIHLVTYNMTARGVYNLSIIANDGYGSQPIDGSPWFPYCHPTDPSAIYSEMWGHGVFNHDDYNNVKPTYSTDIEWPMRLTDNVMRGDRQQRVFVQTVDLFGNNLTDGGSLVSVTATLEKASYNGSFGEYAQRILDGIAVTSSTWLSVDPTEGRTVSGQNPSLASDGGDLGGAAHYSVALTDEGSGVYSGSYYPLISGNYTVVGMLATPGGVDASYFKGIGGTQGTGINPTIEPATDPWWRAHAFASQPTVGVGVGIPMLSFSEATLTKDWGLYQPNAPTGATGATGPTGAMPDPNADSTIPIDYWSGLWSGYVAVPSQCQGYEELTFTITTQPTDTISVEIDGQAMLGGGGDGEGEGEGGGVSGATTYSFTMALPSAATHGETWRIKANEAYVESAKAKATVDKLSNGTLNGGEAWTPDTTTQTELKAAYRAWLDAKNYAAKTAAVAAAASQSGVVLVPLVMSLRHQTGHASIKVEWESVSMARTELASTDLYRILPISDKESVGWPLYVEPSPTDPPTSTAVGTGLLSAIAGVTDHFTVEARDTFGNLRLKGGDQVSSVATQIVIGRTLLTDNEQSTYLGAGSFTTDVIDAGDGTYNMSYYPIIAGVYTMSVLVGTSATGPAPHLDLGYSNIEEATAGSHIRGSPFKVVIHPGATYGSTCTAFGENTYRADAGIATPAGGVTIVARDKHSNVRPGGGDEFVVKLVPVYPQEPRTMTGTAPDPSFDGAVTDNGDGTYSVTYNTTRSGTYDLMIKLRETPSPPHHLDDPTQTYDAEALESDVHIAGSPFRVYVLPQLPSASTSTASGAGSRYGYTNTTTSFTVHARDAYSNLLDRGGAEWYLRLRGPEVVRGVVNDNGDGEYSAEYTPTIKAQPGGVANYSMDVILASPASFTTITASQSNNGVWSGGGGGLTASYYTNKDLHGEPVLRRIEKQVNVNHMYGAVAPSAIDHASVRWQGYVKAPVSDTIKFELVANEGADLLIDGALVASSRTNTGADRNHDDGTSTGWGSVVMEQGVLYEIEVTSYERVGTSSVVLFWQSDRTPRSVVPPFFLYPQSTAAHIHGSPFDVAVF